MFISTFTFITWIGWDVGGMDGWFHGKRCFNCSKPWFFGTTVPGCSTGASKSANPVIVDKPLVSNSKHVNIEIIEMYHS